MYSENIKSIAVGVLMLATFGCQRGEVLGKVSGTVTLDAKPVSDGLVIFSNPAKGVYITATLDAEGKYAVQTANGFGLPLGDYQIAVSPPLPQPAMPGAPKASPPPPSSIPARYLRYETSGLAMTVSEGENRQDIAMHSDNRR